jgi:hypothetical protein
VIELVRDALCDIRVVGVPYVTVRTRVRERCSVTVARVSDDVADTCCKVMDCDSVEERVGDGPVREVES